MTQSPRKKQKKNIPCSMEDLNVEAQNLIWTLGADMKLNSIAISDKLDKTKISCGRVYKRLLMYRDWIAELDDDAGEKDEKVPATDDEIVALFNNNGAKGFDKWFKAIRARAALAETDLMDNDNRDQRREFKANKNKKKSNQIQYFGDDNNNNDNANDSVCLFY